MNNHMHAFGETIQKLRRENSIGQKGQKCTFLAGWYYQGPDIQSSTHGERDWLAGRISAALSRLGAGWATWTAARRHR